MGRRANPTRGFGGVVRKLRLDAGMSQAELARDAKITGGYLAKVELGQASPPSSEVVTRLARALGVQASSLLEAGGALPPVIEKAYGETPEAMLWFASLPESRRRRLTPTRDDDQDVRERDRIRRLAKRLARGES
jgi:transcriptional regulator with XRE-family HTH domain